MLTEHAGVGTLLRTHRLTAGLTQRELADRAGVSVGAVRDLEQGRTRRSRRASLSQLAAALDLDTVATQALLGAMSRRRTEFTADPETDRLPVQGLWLRVLGQLAAWRDGVPIGLGERKQRTILVLLALTPNIAVSRDMLIDAVWANRPPTTAVQLLRDHVSALRRALDPGRSALDPAGLLVSAGRSYRLRVCADELDLLAFQRLVGHARTADSAGEDAAAARSYEQALWLWQGAPLTDTVPDIDHPAVAGIERTRANAICDYAEVACRLGIPQRVLPHLQDLIWRDPLNEQAHARLMHALAASGQQAAALQVFDDLRRRLDRQLGIRPGREIVEMHLRVLRQDLPRHRTAPLPGFDDLPDRIPWPARLSSA